MGVILLPDPVHDPVGLDPQKETAVFAVQPFGVLEAAGRKAAAAAVFRWGWERGDPSRGHLLLFPLFAGECFASSSRAGAPSEASHLPVTSDFLPSSSGLLTDISSPQRSLSFTSPLSLGNKSPPTPLARKAPLKNASRCSPMLIRVIILSFWRGGGRMWAPSSSTLCTVNSKSWQLDPICVEGFSLWASVRMRPRSPTTHTHAHQHSWI